MMNLKLAPGGPGAKAISEGCYRFKLSDDTLDRDGDVINPHGWRLETYRLNPIVLWGHQHTVPAIGKCPYIAIEGHALVGDIQFPPPGTYGFADEVRGLVEAGIISTTSVGFKPIRATPTSKGHQFHEQELIEWSVVNVPANPSASIMGLAPKAAHHAALVKNFLRIEDGRALRLTPHTRGLDLPVLTKWLGAKSDRHYAQLCPRGTRCPNGGPQLPQCPAGDDCPSWDAWGSEVSPQQERGWVVDMTRAAVREQLAPALRAHRIRTTGRLD